MQWKQLQNAIWMCSSIAEQNLWLRLTNRKQYEKVFSFFFFAEKEEEAEKRNLHEKLYLCKAKILQERKTTTATTTTTTLKQEWNPTHNFLLLSFHMAWRHGILQLFRCTFSQHIGVYAFLFVLFSLSDLLSVQFCIYFFCCRRYFRYSCRLSTQVAGWLYNRPVVNKRVFFLVQLYHHSWRHLNYNVQYDSSMSICALWQFALNHFKYLFYRLIVCSCCIGEWAEKGFIIANWRWYCLLAYSWCAVAIKCFEKLFLDLSPLVARVVVVGKEHSSKSKKINTTTTVAVRFRKKADLTDYEKKELQTEQEHSRCIPMVTYFVHENCWCWKYIRHSSAQWYNNWNLSQTTARWA